MRLFLAFLLSASVVLSVFLYQKTVEYQILKIDYVNINRVQYGLLNIDRWKDIVLSIINKEIDSLQVIKENEDMLRSSIHKILHSAIDRAEEQFKKDELVGFRRLLFNPFGRAREQVSDITEDTLGFVKHRDNRVKLKKIIADKVNQYANKTFSSVDYSLLKQIQQKYHDTDMTKLNLHIADLIEKNRQDTQPLKWLFYLLASGIFLLLWLDKSDSKVIIIMGLMACLTFLSLGLLLPMIELDARIATLAMSIIGEPVSFNNQILFYQSKSIIDVVWLLIAKGSVEVVSVGILVFCFSVLFPFLKLSSSVLVLFKPQLSHQRILHFFVYQSGKWSMADVFIVSIFMTYIGFNSIVAEQLSQLGSTKEPVTLLTTNGTSLMLGFFSFLFFVMISIMTSSRIKQILKT